MLVGKPGIGEHLAAHLELAHHDEVDVVADGDLEASPQQVGRGHRVVRVAVLVEVEVAGQDERTLGEMAEERGLPVATMLYKLVSRALRRRK